MSPAVSRGCSTRRENNPERLQQTGDGAPLRERLGSPALRFVYQFVNIGFVRNFSFTDHHAKN
jgi:hypothetical protein